MLVQNESVQTVGEDMGTSMARRAYRWRSRLEVERPASEILQGFILEAEEKAGPETLSAPALQSFELSIARSGNNFWEWGTFFFLTDCRFSDTLDVSYICRYCRGSVWRLRPLGKRAKTVAQILCNVSRFRINTGSVDILGTVVWREHRQGVVGGVF